MVLNATLALSVCTVLAAPPPADDQADLPPPIVERIDHHDWEVRTLIYFGGNRPDVQRSRPYRPSPYLREESMEEALRDYIEREIRPISASSFTIYLPHIETGATHDADPQRIELNLYYQSEIDGAPFQFISGAVLAEQLIMAEIGPFRDTIINVRLHRWMRTYDIAFHEERAFACPFWSYWPAEIDQFLQPSPYIEARDPDLVRLVKGWIGEEAWRLPPHLVAKALTGKVLETIRVNGTSIRKFRVDVPYYLGLDVAGARAAFAAQQGTHVDIACAIVAALRIAEIPARTVIGIDSETEKLHVWFEYCLHDPVRGENIWVPVNLEDARQQTNVTPDLSRRWDGFGHFGEIENRIPLAYHFAPQVGYPGDYPCLWSWQPGEEFTLLVGTGGLQQIVDHEVLTAPNRGDDELPQQPTGAR